jgi:hypothetical protein
MILKTASTTPPIIISSPAHAHNMGEKYFAPYLSTMKNIFRITALAFVATLSFFNVKAQTPYRQFGIKAGMNISNVSTNLSNYTTKDIAGGSVSLTFDRVHFRFLTVGGEFNLVQRGFSNSIMLTDSMGTQLGVADIRNKFNYFSVPLKLGVQLGNRAYVFGNVAFVPGYLLKAIAETPVLDASGQIIDYTWQDATSTAAQFELSTQIEVGVGVTKAKRYKFYVSAAKQQGWTNLFNNPASAFDFKSTGIIISTGMKIEFGKGLLR